MQSVATKSPQMTENMQKHEVKESALDKADFSSFCKKFPSRLSVSIRFPAFVAGRKANSLKLPAGFFSPEFLPWGGEHVHLIPVYQPRESLSVFLVN